jgi:hypothetical protein
MNIPKPNALWCVAAGILCATQLMSAACAGDGLHWSLSKPQHPEVPDAAQLAHGDRVRNPIDAFILQRLQQEQLDPAPLADKYALVRRAYFDLLGLPPTPEQVQNFVNDTATDAWPRLIDELLKSPQYGERWGRHWLDVARYADSGGYETDIYYRNAWRYRDYVVKSFNEDKPYDVFVQEQIAGDELWPDNLDLDPKRVYITSEQQRKHLEARIGTGLYALGPQIHESGLDARRLRYEILTDWVDTTGSAFLGLTIGCARCHDHKFDPLTQQDYFALQAAFAGSIEVELPLLTAMELADWKQFYPRVVAVEEARRAYRLFEQQLAGRPATAAEEQQQRELLENIARRVLELPERAGSVPNSPFDGLMEIPRASVLGHERRELVQSVRLLDRGELSRPEHAVDAAIPAALATATASEPALAQPFGGRKQLALWLTQPDHPLTARVMVNRIWQGHFGQGLVSTPNDFGTMGTPPSHPQLLDWLASEFVEQGWSIKQMHRLIMLSGTYQLSSRFATDSHLSCDPENRLLWRMHRRRLEAEALWDAVHAVAGTLNLKAGGRPVVPPLADDELAALREKWHWPVSADPADHTRRGIYILVRRNFPFPMFEVFDAPVMSVSCPQRDVTTVALQALWSLNNRSVAEQARKFSAQVIATAGDDPQAWIDRAWRMAVARPPTAEEAHEALTLLEDLAREAPGENTADARREALAQLCLAIFNLNEFAFVD